MCGIFGILSEKSNLTYAQEKFILDAIIAGQLRGEDGTGLLCINDSGEADIYKRSIPGSDFLYSRVGASAKRGLANAKAVIGHNRKTTTGGNGHAACHPFSYGNLMGVHNGTFPHAVLERLKDKDTKVRVDSAKFYSSLAKADDSIDVLKLLHAGSYALSWYDATQKELRFARNKDRPLWVANGRDGLYWASEPGMLFWLMTRHALAVEESELHQLDTDTLYKISLEDISSIDKDKYTPKAPTYKKPVNVTTHNYHGSWLNRDKAESSMRHYRDLSTLRKELPSLSFHADTLEDTYSIIKNNVQDSIQQPDSENYVDMVLTNYERPANANATITKFPDIWGYMIDETESGLIFPIKLAAISEHSWGLREKIEDRSKSNSYPTMRVKITNVRVYSTGVIVLLADPVISWDDESDVKKDDNTNINSRRVASCMTLPKTDISGIQHKKLWESLESKDKMTVN